MLRQFNIFGIAFCLFITLFSESLYSKELKDGFLWSVDFNTVFDNREGDKTYSPQGTYLFARVSPEVGVRFLKWHEIKGGVSYLQPMGIGFKQNKFSPIFYYTYTQPEKRIWNVSVGMIPRYKMIRPTPKILFSDSLSYYNPVIQGVLLQCRKDSFQAEVMLDWRGLQSSKQREAFSVLINIEGMPVKLFYVGGHFQINHLAKQNPPVEGQGVNDDWFVNPYVGLDFKSITPLDSFRIQTGLALGMERWRAAGGWKIPKGFLMNLCIEWKKIGLKEDLYIGENQFPFYSEFGPLLNLGEPFYQAKIYSYTFLYANIVRNRMVNFQTGIDFHITQAGLACYQKILLRTYIDRDLWKVRKKPQKGWINNIY